MPRPDLQRLLSPRRIALIGAGAWTDAVAAGNRQLGFRGELWRVHPTRETTSDKTYYRSVAELPDAPDAAFIAVPSAEAPAIAGALAAAGTGGFVCFSAGFAETGRPDGERLTRELVAQARELPFLGPNCYGFVNFFDRAALLPDEVVGGCIERGVALICQSGTIALTLMFNDRSLPLGYLITVGNQTCLAVEDLIEYLCVDPRVTAFGLYLEGVKDGARLAQAAARARAAGKPIAVIKSGRTAAAARTARSHTGALAGADSVFDAFCRQAGLARCDTLGTLCETLKLFHAGGTLPGRRVLMMGTSGGDMSMTADVARTLDLEFPPIPDPNAARLASLLTHRVTVANPFDLHTYLWFDPPGMRRVFVEALRSGYDAVGLMLDCPPESSVSTSFDAIIDVYIEAARGAPSRALLVASLPETLNRRVRERCLAGGVVPLQGQREALEALALASAAGAAWTSGEGELSLRFATHDGAASGGAPSAGMSAGNASSADMPSAGAPSGGSVVSLDEAEAKAALAGFGVTVARGRVTDAAAAADAATELGFPVAIKAVGAGLEHKTEVGAVVLNVRSRSEAEAAAARLRRHSPRLLVEEMTHDGIAEIIVGVVHDPQFGQTLVLAAGGIFTELMADSATLLPPWTRETVRATLQRLRVFALLAGYRGGKRGDVAALIELILNVGRYAQSRAGSLTELDVNPVIVRPEGLGAVAVDALVRLNRTVTL